MLYAFILHKPIDGWILSLLLLLTLASTVVIMQLLFKLPQVKGCSNGTDIMTLL